MRVALGCDHAGYRYKEAIKELLTELGHVSVDFGTHSEESVDYPRFVRPAAEAVASGECDRGIVLGGSGNGEGIRCALCWSRETAIAGREHNDANVLALGERMISKELALEIVRLFLDTDFEGGRHERRLRLLES